ncbi:MAG: response regulator transcription factor [Chloroflexi bacterium]|nr:response regulator transcription factor [Chloroflexota bacterium]
MASAAIDRQIIGVLIADDHPVVRKGLSDALGAEPDIRVLGEARDGVEAASKTAQLKPDLVIMDLYMPKVDGIQALVSIKVKQPDIKVLMLTVSDREDDLLKAIRFGADGYFLKGSDVTDVVAAVRQIARGETVLSPYISQKLMKEMLDKQGVFGLSAREKEVLELLGEGLANTDIAARLVLSEKTVSTYIYRLLQKLHLKNREEAIAYSVRNLHHSEPY